MQNLDGHDVALFAMYVFENDQVVRSGNRRAVYIPYLDSVKLSSLRPYAPPCTRNHHGFWATVSGATKATMGILFCRQWRLHFSH